MCVFSRSVVSNSLKPHGLPGFCQAPLSMELSRQEYLGGLPLPTQGDLPNAGIGPASFVSPALTGEFFNSSITWEAHITYCM